MADGDGETITYQFEHDLEDWREWTESLSRYESIDDRLRALIHRDVDSRVGGDLDDPETADRTTVAAYIRFHATQGIAAARRDRTDDALDRLQRIMDLADAIAESPD